MKRIKLLIILISGLVFSQETMLNIGSEKNERFTTSLKTNDGSLFVFGQRGNCEGALSPCNDTSQDDNIDPIIYKFNSNLELEWSKEYQREYVDYFTSATIYNNHIYITGTTTVGFVGSNYTDRDFLVIKMDLGGNIIWSKIFGGECNGTETYCGDFARKIIVHNDTIFVSGYYAFAGTGLNDAAIIKLNLEGNLIEESIIDNGLGSNFFLDATKTSNENILYTGYSKNNGTWEPWLHYLDQQNNVLFSNTYGDQSTNNDAGFKTIFYNQNFYMLTTYSGQFVNLNKIDEDGNLVWSRKFEGSNAKDIFVYGGEIYIAVINNYQNTLGIIKINTNGNLIQQKQFSYMGGGAYPLKMEIINNQLVIAGTVEYVSNGYDDIYLMTIDPLLNDGLLCLEDNEWSSFYFEENNNVFQSSIGYSEYNITQTNNIDLTQNPIVQNLLSNSCGCLDTNACNYDPGATIFSNVCEYESCIGCTDPEACNYNQEAIEDNGTCEYIEEVDLGDDIVTCEELIILDAGEGYDSYLWSTGENTQTIEVNESGNYNVEAVNNLIEPIIETQCGYQSDGYINPDTGLLSEEGWMYRDILISENESVYSIFADFYRPGVDDSGHDLIIQFYENCDNIFDCEGYTFYSLFNYQLVDTSLYQTELLVSDFIDSGSTFFNMGFQTEGPGVLRILAPLVSIEDQWSDLCVTLLSNPTCSTSDNINVTLNVCGCMDLSANNFNSIANVDDGSCEYSGCTDSTACNFNSVATIEDNSCEYIQEVNLGEDIVTCEEFITLDAGEGYGSYLWSTGENTQTIEVNESGNYNVQVGNGTQNNNSIIFDGINSNFLATNNNIYNNNEIISGTLSLQVKIEDLVINQQFFSLEGWLEVGYRSELSCIDEPGIFAVSDGSAVCQGSGVFYPLSQIENSDDWINISIIWGGEAIELIINGVTVDNNNPISTPLVDNNDRPLTFGVHSSFSSPNSSYFTGLIDNIQIWGNNLSYSQINEYINCPPFGNEDGLIGYWNFNDSLNEDQAVDLSSNGNNATINGASYTQNISNNCESCSDSDNINITFNVCGCTDFDADNYNPEANVEDGSCEYLGCMDEGACNYDPDATIAINVCDYESCAGCMDEVACNFNITSTIEDNSCEYIQEVDLGEDIITCEEMVIIDAGAGYDSYYWSTGETTQTIEVVESGNYTVSVENGNTNNYSMYFDNNDVVEITTEDDINEIETYTFNAWVKIDEVNDFQPVFWIGNTNESELEIYTTNTNSGAGPGLRVVHKRSNPQLFNYNIFPPLESSWLFLSVVFNEGLISVYFNNQEQGIIDNGNDNLFSNILMTDMRIGYQDAGSGTQTINLNGFIDDVSFFNTALDFNERQSIMNCSLTGDENGLIGYWNFEEGAEGGQVIDVSGNGNNGNVIGAIYDNEIPTQECQTNCQSSNEVYVTLNTCGCMDPLADNFEINANVDDGSCEYLGCTEQDACNFDPLANTDDGSCQLCSSIDFVNDSYIDVDTEIINTQGLTISFWVNDDDFCENPSDFNTYIDFGSQESYRYVIRNRSCKIEAFFEGDMLPTEFSWGTMNWDYPKASAAGGIGPQSGWRQITVTFCPTNVRIYVDGQIVASSGTGVYFESGFNLLETDIKRIGGNQIDYEPANVMIDEVRLWDRALSQEEIIARSEGSTTLNIDQETNLNGYWKMDCANPFLNEITGNIGSEGANSSIYNENFNNNSCETVIEYDYSCPVDFSGQIDCNSCDPPEGCTDEGACNYDYLAVISIDACFYVEDFCPDIEYPEYYNCECKCINDEDNNDVCDELEGCSDDQAACNYNPLGSGECLYADDLFGVDYLDCSGNCLNDFDVDGICDELDNCLEDPNPNQEDYDGDGEGDVCDQDDGLGIDEKASKKKLIKIVDVLGREINNINKKQLILYIYNNGEIIPSYKM